MPGYGRLSFIIYLKSLIDPSFFREEKQLRRGRIMNYARKMENDMPDLCERLYYLKSMIITMR